MPLLMGLFYIVIPFVVLFVVLRIFFTKRVCTMVTLNSFIVIFMLTASMIAGLCLTAFYKPTSYWKAFELAPTIMDAYSNRYLVGENVWAMFLVPFVGFIQFVAYYFEAWTHWTIAIVIMHVAGLFCIEKFTEIVYSWTTDQTEETAHGR